MHDREKKTTPIQIISHVILLLFLFPPVLAGCITPDARNIVPDLYKGQIAIFLNGQEKPSQDITFDLIEITMVSEDGTSRQLLDSPRTINSKKIAGRQFLLSEKGLPEGKYTGLKLLVRDASVMRKGKSAGLSLPAETIELDINIKLNRLQSTSLFLGWNPDASIEEGFSFSPVFSARGEAPELSSLLIFVTNEESNTVSAINRQYGETVASIMVGKKPRGIISGRRGNRQRVYVANSGSNSVSVIDPVINRVENEIPIRLGWEPTGIGINSAAGDRELLFVANYRSNSVSVVDTAAFREIENIAVGNGPIEIAVDPPVEELLESRFLNYEDIDILRNYRRDFFNVYVVNRNSNDISILKMDRKTSRVSEVITVDVEWDPVNLEIDYQRAKVYVANYNSDKLSVIDILQIIKGKTGGTVSTIHNVGRSIIGVVSDPAFNRLYLLRETPGEILIIRPFSNGLSPAETSLPPVIGIIPAGKSPRALIMDPESRRLYVVNRGGNSISVIDKTTKQQEQEIPVGKRPYGITVLTD
jgi:YVTN family beta-propeller protein